MFEKNTENIKATIRTKTSINKKAKNILNRINHKFFIMIPAL
jgi:hypothetical protein